MNLPRKRTNSIATAILGANLLTGCFAQNIKTENEKDKTSACYLLQEGTAQNSHQKLHELIKKAKEKLSIEPNKNEIFAVIHQTLKEEGYTSTKHTPNLDKSIQTKKTTNTELAILYASIAQKIGAPIRLMPLPEKTLVVWDENLINDSEDVIWDINEGKIKTIDDCIKESNIPKSALVNNFYLTGLDTKQTYAIILTEQGKKLLKTNTQQAIDKFSQAIALEPRLLSAIIERGTAHLKQDKFNYTMADAKNAIIQYPELPEGYLLRAKIEVKLGKAISALEQCSKAIQLNPESAEAYRLKAQIKILQRIHPRFIAGDIDYAIKLEPENPTGYYIRGCLKQSKGDTADAEKDFEMYKQLQEENEK